jgi:magnesium transporter
LSARRAKTDHLNDPVVHHARSDFPALSEHLTVAETLQTIRRQGLGEKIVYFYAVDDDDRLVGVIPTRRLLTSEPHTRLADIMIRHVVTIPADATLLDAAEFFVLHRFLAFPVVDRDNRILGIVDVNLFTREVYDLYDLAEQQQTADVFQWIGFRVSQIKHSSPVLVYWYRFRWLIATMASGIVAAILVSNFEAVLGQALVLAFFLTLVLGLGEGVSMQSMTVTLQHLHVAEASWSEYRSRIRGELLTAVLLGASCGLVVGGVAAVWRGPGEYAAALVIGASILASIVAACLLGVSIPMLLHATRMDPNRIAAGPITLALADLCTLVLYFTAAWLVLSA